MIEPEKQKPVIPVRICAIIPTYNNATTIESVITETSQYLSDIIIVNDGSTDTTESILQSIANANHKINLIEFETNKGKGAALRAAFDTANAKGFTHAITLDADGQHYPGDIPAFLEKIAQGPDTLWIGDRVLRNRETGEPPRSAAGRKFGSFWYKFITGLDIRDTQCGFRAYPLQAVANLHCTGDRYEFEQEALVKSAWNGIPVQSVPVHLFYASKAQAVSHFRPVRDFLRIFKVNSKAIMIKIFLPFLIVDMPGATWAQKIGAMFKYELSAHATPKRAAASLSLGVFLGLFPIYGFQVATLMALAFILKINKPLAFLGVGISSPPFLPFIIALAVATGRLVVPASWDAAVAHGRYGALISGGIQWFFGSIILAFVFAGVCLAISYPVFVRLKTRADKRKAGN
jgi:glycosyltransferase involved in cell wall biosynthesis